jgi:hypothetical protein
MNNFPTLSETHSVYHLVPLCCLGIMLIGAGCMTWPVSDDGGEERPSPVIMNNTANVTQSFTVWTVEGVLNNREVEIHKKRDPVDRASPGTGLSTYRLDGDYGYVTSIEVPPNRSQFHGEYTLASGEETRININSSSDATIIVVLSKDERVISFAAVHCGESGVPGLEVVGYPYPPGGVFAAYECG